MSYACLGDRGVEALSYALAVNRIVKGLYLKHCQMSAVGIKHLFQSLLVRMHAEGAKELLDAATSETVHQQEAVRISEMNMRLPLHGKKLLNRTIQWV